MKSGITLLSVITTLLFTFGCQEKRPYDNSTPEKMMISLTSISKQPKEINPIPYFYTKDNARAIISFDEAGGRALGSFESFKEALTTHFPTKIKRIRENKIELHTEGNSFSSQEFTLSASLIRKQLQEQTPSAYEFVSASEPDENGIIVIDYTMLGKNATLEVVKEDGQYVMHMKDESIVKLGQMTTFFNKADTLLSAFTKSINQQDMTDENFQNKTKEWSNQYMDLIKILN